MQLSLLLFIVKKFISSGDPTGSLPYSNIYNYKKFKSYYRNVFIPGADIVATITDYERSATTHILNPNLWVFILVLVLM